MALSDSHVILLKTLWLELQSSEAGLGRTPLGPSLHPAGSLHAGYRCCVAAEDSARSVDWREHLVSPCGVDFLEGMSVGFQENIPLGKSQLTAIYQASVLPHTCKNPISQNMSHVQAQSH